VIRIATRSASPALTTNHDEDARWSHDDALQTHDACAAYVTVAIALS